LCGTIQAYPIKRAITSPLEHHAVLHTLENLHKIGILQELVFVAIDEKGHINTDHLETLLKDQPTTLVSLMHGNNEIGNLTDIANVGAICKAHGAIFHSDTVQTIGHYAHNLSQLPVDFVVGSAHKFHGPKGVGFLYINHNVKIPPFIQGGAQERNMRGGTENMAGIIGMATALELAYQHMEEHRKHITSLKKRMIEGLTQRIQGVDFNGDSANLEKSLYTVLNVCLPPSELNEMLIFNLDIHKIAASAGSACSSGTNIGSHVLQAIATNPNCGSVRFSFSRMNTEAEIDYVVNTLAQLLKK
jgi:cysteine desulfurase